MEPNLSKLNAAVQSKLYEKVGVIALEGGGCATVDTSDYALLSSFRWRRVQYHRCHYARIIDNQSPPFKATTMHRAVNHTPADMVCHHRNRNTLDNRKTNLLNMTRKKHELLHKNNSLLIKFSTSADDSNIKLSTPAEQENQPSLPRPDPHPEKKKAEITTGRTLILPIISQLMTQPAFDSKPPVMSQLILSSTFISVFYRAVNQ